MKSELQKTMGLILVTLACIMPAKATNWANLSNFTQVTQIAKQGDKIWVAAKGGVMLYDPITDTKTFYTKQNSALPSISVEKIAYCAYTNEVWIGTYDNGIARLNNGTWEHHPFPASDALLYSMRVASDGSIWCATSRALYRYENGQFTTYLGVQSFSAPTCWDAAPIKDGKLFCAGFQPFIFDPATNTTINFHSSLFAYGSAKAYVVNDSSYYYMSDHGAIGYYVDTTEIDTSEGFIQPVIGLQKLGNGDLLAVDEGRQMYQKHNGAWDTIGTGKGIAETFLSDDNGDLWIAGVNFTDDMYGKMLHITAQNQTSTIDLRRTGISSNYIRQSTSADGNMIFNTGDSVQFYDVNAQQFGPSIATPSNLGNGATLQLNGKIYMGTSYAYLYQYSNGQWTQLGQNVLPNGEVDVLKADKDGNLWLGGRDFLAKYDGQHFTVYDASNSLPIFNSLYIRDIYCDSTHNSIWVASYSGILRLQNGTFTMYNDSLTPGIQQYYDAVSTIQEDAHHNIWFGTVYGGLLKFDGTDFSSMLLPYHVGNQVVTGLAFDQDTMYISDNLYGVWIYANGQWDSLTRSNSGLTVNAVYGLQKDKNNNLWMQTNGFGVDVYYKNEVPTGIKEPAANQAALLAYPNPTDGRFTVLNPTDKAATLTLYNITGQLIMQQTLTGTHTDIDLSEQPNGVYLVRLTAGNQVHTSKLVKD